MLFDILKKKKKKLITNKTVVSNFKFTYKSDFTNLSIIKTPIYCIMRKKTRINK